MQWSVVITLFQETIQYHNQKDGCKGTPKLGPYWKLQQVICSKYGVEVRIMSLSRDTTHFWIRISHESNKFCDEFEKMKQKFPKISSKNMRQNWMQKIFHADQRQKQNSKEENLLFIHRESFPLKERIESILNQGSILSPNTRYRRK